VYNSNIKNETDNLRKGIISSQSRKFFDDKVYSPTLLTFIDIKNKKKIYINIYTRKFYYIICDIILYHDLL
jgi:hypothetical protein